MNNKIMKKITALLTTMGLLVIPLTGCSSNIKIFGKEGITIEELDDIEFNKTTPNDNQEESYTEEDAIEAIVQGEYNVNYKGQQFSFNAAEILNLIFPNSAIHVKTITDTIYQVKLDNGTEYVIFEVDFIDENVNEIEMLYDGDLYKDEEAHQMMIKIITMIIEEELIK